MNKILGITIALFAIIIVLGLYVNSTKEKTASIDASEALQIQEADHVSGDLESGVVLTEFLDFQCPACAAYHPIINQLRAQNPDIAVVTRNFPLSFHQNARSAAYAAEAAAMQGQYKAMSDVLFENQATWSPLNNVDGVFEGYATTLGLDITQYNQDRKSDVVKEKVDFDYQSGVAAGVDSTPSFYLQDKKITGLRSLEDFQTAIDEAQKNISSASTTATSTATTTVN